MSSHTILLLNPFLLDRRASPAKFNNLKVLYLFMVNCELNQCTYLLPTLTPCSSGVYMKATKILVVHDL